MSQGNVEVVARMFRAYNAGDIDAMISFYALDLEAFPDASVFPEAGAVHGRDDWRRWVEEAGTAWLNVKWATREVIAVEDGRVVNRGDWGGEGVASGIETVSSIT